MKQQFLGWLSIIALLLLLSLISSPTEANDTLLSDTTNLLESASFVLPNESSEHSDMLNRPFLQAGTSEFQEVQSIPTSGGHDWEYFSIDGDHYLAVTNSYNGSTRNLDSKIYKWNGTSFLEFQSITANGANEWKFFTIGQDHYLALANYYNGVTHNLNSEIYRWDGNNFVEFQSIPTNGARNWEFFTIDNDHYLALSNFRNDSIPNIDSKIYRWDGDNFVEFQSISTIGASDWEFFTIDSDYYLALANRYNGSTHNVDSKIFRWNGSTFVELQSIPTNGAVMWESFTIEADHYLALANYYNDSNHNIDSKIFRWNGSSFVELQFIPANGGANWEFFTIGQTHYLALANYRNNSTYDIDSKIFRWNGSGFAEFQSIPTIGALDWEYFTIAGQHYLAGANWGNGAIFNIDSKIYKWNGLSFRSFDGIGNNLSNSTYGSVNSQLLRFWESPFTGGVINTPSDYGDGISTPAGAERRSARAISNEVAAQLELVPNLLGASDFLWQWGQFVDHDMDLTGAQEEPSEELNILVPQGDSFFDPMSTGTAVITFTRSVFDETTGTGLDNPRQQINQITAWIDASQVYGSNLMIVEWKRTFEGGKLKSSAGNLLPLKEQSEVEFTAGDMRANEQIGLTALHTLFMREHNRLADLIAAANPGMSDEDIFQRARAIVGAQIQQITYNEFLPLLLGVDALPAYTGYNEQINPNISNVFSTAPFRFGHTMLSPTLLRFDENGNEIANGHVPLRGAFFNPQLIIEDGIDPILRGLGMQQAQAVDPLLIDDVRHLLFGPPGSGGLDLAALNIQRGRDHGLPSYKAVREALGLGSVSSFADITSDVERQNALAAAYNNDVDQVDLWVGGLAEDHADGALVGPTFQAIIADQFTRLRDGDRFWHQNLDWSAYGFAADPLLHENGTTLSDLKLSDIIRWNTAISNIQDNVFLVPALEVGQSVSSPVAEPGDTLTYQIVLTTTASTSNATVIDRLPAGLTYVADSVTGGATFADGQIRYDGPVSADTPHSISYQATVDSNLADGTILYSTALATWQGMPLEDMVTVVIEDLTVEHTLVLLYVNGDNDLSEFMLELVNKAEFAAGNPDATVLLLLDGPDDEGAYLYRLQEDFDPGCPNYINPTCDGRYVMGQTMWQWHENIATPSSLSEFLIGAKRAYPQATQIALSLAGHGGGWAPTTLAAQPMGYNGLSGGPGGLLWDEHRRLSLSTRELGQALTRFERKTGSKIDLLLLDACLMGMSEVAYEVRDTVDYLLASESWSWTSFAYDDHLNAITSETNAREIGEAWLANEASILRDDDYPFTYSLMDLSQMTTLREAQDNLANELIALLPNDKAKIDAAFAQSACFDSDGNGQIIQPNNNPDALPLDYYCDLHSFAEQLKAEFSDQSTLVEAAQALQDTIASAVLTEDHNNGIPWRYSNQYWQWDELGGLSGYLPLVTDHFNRRYYTGRHVRFAKDGQWDDFLKAYWNTTPPDDPECPPEGCDLPPGPLPIAPITLNGSTSQNSIALSWVPQEAFANPLDHYDLYRSADNGSSYSLIASLPESEYTDNDAALTQGTDYCYQIKAFDSANEVIGESNVPCLSLAEPTGTTLTCSLNLQARPPAPHPAWSILIKGSLTIPGASEPAHTFTLTTDEHGRFTLDNLEAGDYEYRLKGNTTLENLLNITIAEGDNTFNCGTLLEGDATDDNFIALDDFAALADAFGTCQGEPAYDARADFTNDQCVALDDFGALADNFGKGGPIIVELTP